MASLLVLSQDASTIQIVEEIAAELGFRLRSAASVAAARNWLTMQSFEGVIVDSRLSADEASSAGQSAMGFFRDVWKHNSLCNCVLLNPDAAIENRWAVVLAGVLTAQPPDAFKQLREILKSIPRAVALGENFRHAVMVVEDLDSPRDIICAYIESLGYSTVVGVSSAPAALAELEKSPDNYFCVISDLQMPQVSGLELIKQVRKSKLLRHLPIVVLTSQSSAENLLACIRAGASGFLVKPPKRQQLEAELLKAKRTIAHKRSPRICRPEETKHLEDALRALGLF